MKTELKQIFDDLFNALNHMGNEENIEEALQYALMTQHRTLQQNFFRQIIVPSIKMFSEKLEKQQYDLRNEASCKLAAKIHPLTKNEGLPFI